MKNMPQSMIIEREATAREKFGLLKSIIAEGEKQTLAGFAGLTPEALQRLRLEPGPEYDLLRELVRVARHEERILADRRERWIRDHRLEVGYVEVEVEDEEKKKRKEKRPILLDRNGKPTEVPRHLFRLPDAIIAEIAAILTSMSARRTEEIVDKTLLEQRQEPTPLAPGTTADHEEGMDEL